LGGVKKSIDSKLNQGISGNLFSLVALIFLGFGMAPVVPVIIHETPLRFGTANSTAITGYQFAVSNIGVIGVPAAGGFIITNAGMAAYPVLLFLLVALMTLSVWWDALPGFLGSIRFGKAG
jgi:predicted MFS family arabinose efflux permease